MPGGQGILSGSSKGGRKSPLPTACPSPLADQTRRMFLICVSKEPEIFASATPEGDLACRQGKHLPGSSPFATGTGQAGVQLLLASLRGLRPPPTAPEAFISLASYYQQVKTIFLKMGCCTMHSPASSPPPPHPRNKKGSTEFACSHLLFDIKRVLRTCSCIHILKTEK